MSSGRDAFGLGAVRRWSGSAAVAKSAVGEGPPLAGIGTGLAPSTLTSFEMDGLLWFGSMPMGFLALAGGALLSDRSRWGWLLMAVGMVVAVYGFMLLLLMFMAFGSRGID